MTIIGISPRSYDAFMTYFRAFVCYLDGEEIQKPNQKEIANMNKTLSLISLIAVLTLSSCQSNAMAGPHLVVKISLTVTQP